LRPISEELILRKGTTAESANRCIETSASRIVGSNYFCRRFFAFGVHVNAHFAVTAVVQNCSDHAMNQFCIGGPDSIRNGDGPNALSYDAFDSFRDFFFAP